jgi:CHAT domain-containing protein
MKIQFPIKEDPIDSLNGAKKTYLIGSDTRGNSNNKEITLTETEYIQFVYDDGTTWFSDSETIHELFPEIKNANRDAATTFQIPIYLDASTENRGLAGRIILKVIRIFAKPVLARKVKDIASDLENRHLNLREGLNRLNSKFELVDFDSNKSPDDRPYLLFIHGTNSDTIGAFSALKTNGAFGKIVTSYGENILAFQHRTLTESPLSNAAALVEKLPDNITLHIISHSRGGLIGDILSKYASNKGFIKEDSDLLKKEDRTDDVIQIEKLNNLFNSKKITVEKFVRVASPSAGTLLASERIDHIINILFNLLGDKLNIIADLTHELISSVLDQKNNVDSLPGLEAMNPGSPFIKVLNYKRTSTAIDGKPLMVISGNGALNLSFHGVLVILGKLLYQQRNDLVVNTDSMYLGAQRNTNIQYFFEEESYVDHVHYFVNPTTQTALLNALKTPVGEIIPGYKSVMQFQVPASDRGIFGLDSGELFPDSKPPSGKKPIVILLPGIMGSNIYTPTNRLWLNYWGIISGDLKNMPLLAASEAKSVIKTSYAKLYRQLSFTYDVVLFPFDWRQPMAVTASLLNDKIIELMALNKPIKIIGHSMGGVLVRDFMVYHSQTWKALNATLGFKLLFLGTPLKGSHRILAVLFGEDKIINKLSSLDITHTKKELISIFSQLPGILALLPLTETVEEDYSKGEIWSKMRIALGDRTWPLPVATAGGVLDGFKDYRSKVNKLVNENGIDYTNIVYIAGQDDKTVCGYTIEKNKLFFEYTREGDHSVTWELGIPKELKEKNQVYYSSITHGDLANAPSLFSGIEEILSKGSTSKLSQVKPSFRDGSATFRVAEHFDFDLSENGLENTILGIGSPQEEKSSETPITVTVSQGDLSYASFHVMAGHFKNDAILYAEKAIDTNLNSILKYKQSIGSYPGDIGTSEIFDNDTPFFKGAIIVGIGEPGKLTSFSLAKTVEIGITDYLLRLCSAKNCPDTIGVSSLLMGSGYGGLSIQNSAVAIVEGITKANQNIASLTGIHQCRISNLEFIEQDESIAVNCLFAAKKMENDKDESHNIVLQRSTVKKLFGSRKRFNVESEIDWWNRITIKTVETIINERTLKRLNFNATTSDAREEENELFSSTSLIDAFINEISVENSWSKQRAQTLFELLIPNNFKDQLKRKGSISWVLDKESAAYPWELLQDNSANAKPLCIDAGMIRQLITKNYRLQINRVTVEKALIVADPLLNSKTLNQLAGAVREGNAVENRMNIKNYDYKSLINQSAAEITTALFAESYKIIHLAGHGIYDPDNPERTGMVIGDEKFLTPSQINQMSNVPEFVFVNCCHLGKIVGVDDELYHQRYRLAANIGTQLIEIGVKAVIVAGWQVEDNAAEKFADQFYKELFDGASFGNAVKRARTSIYNEADPQNNTWGAYQCYGDPYYRLYQRRSKAAAEVKNYTIEEEAIIDLENLLNSLDVRGTKSSDILDSLKIISNGRIKAAFPSCTRITEIEALIYYELGMYEQADLKFVALNTNEDAKFSVVTLEKYCTNKTYLHFENYLEEEKIDKDESDKKESDKAITDFNKIVKNYKYLSEINDTSERKCLLAGTYKRIGYVSKTISEKLEAYNSAIQLYKKAYDSHKHSYALNNYLIYQSILDMDTLKTGIPISPGEKTEYKTSLTRKIQELTDSEINMDYWEKADYNYTKLALFFLDPKISKEDSEWEKLYQSYKETREKYGSIGKKKAEMSNLLLILGALDVLAKDEKGLFKNKHAQILQTKINALKLE